MGQTRRWFRIESKADETAEISIFDEIGASWFGGMTAKDFKSEFDAVKGSKSIKVLLNSPGGDVFDGLAIYNLLSSVREKVTVEVMGLAASAASVIALAGKTLTMGEGTYLMIHNPWALAVGTAEDMTKMAETLTKMSGTFADLYESRSALTRDEVLAAMAEETWYTAEEAVDAGFATEVVDYGEVAACGDLTKFRYSRVPAAMAARAGQRKTPETIRDFESFLRDAGYSRQESKAIASRGFKAQRDAGPEVVQEAARPTYSLLLRIEENRRKMRRTA